MISGVRVACFDVDDTLLMTYERVFAKVVRTAEVLGVPAPRPPGFHTGYLSGDPAGALRMWFPGRAPEEVASVYDSVQREFPDVPAPGLAELSARLRSAGLVVGVLSNSARQKLDRKLCALPAAANLDFAFGAEDLPAAKPSARCFEPVLQVTGARPAEVVYVGDARTDWVAATAAGVMFVRLRRPWHTWTAPGNLRTADDLAAVAALILA
jgi:phosphoglycolate phosphatase-like HAD superfamily hydrolase